VLSTSASSLHNKDMEDTLQVGCFVRMLLGCLGCVGWVHNVQLSGSYAAETL
jgi:hypothetical protein